jgi:hypothetical protein
LPDWLKQVMRDAPFAAAPIAEAFGAGQEKRPPTMQPSIAGAAVFHAL